MKTLIKLLCVSLLLLFPFASQAWDGTVSGTISRLDGVGGSAGAPGNYDFRVYLKGVTTSFCNSSGNNWGYINSDDANYKGLVALLTMAYATGKTVTLYTTKAASGYCQIGYVSVSG